MLVLKFCRFHLEFHYFFVVLLAFAVIYRLAYECRANLYVVDLRVSIDCRSGIWQSSENGVEQVDCHWIRIPPEAEQGRQFTARSAQTCFQ